MNKTEFLQGLEEALAGEVSDSVIRDNLNYYSNYISGEISRGRTEKEVLDELGSPRLIARTIISSTEAAEDPGSYRSGTYTDSMGGDSRKPHTFHMSGGLISIILLLLTVVIVLGVVKLAGGLIFVLIRYAGPILFVVLLLFFIKKMRR